MTRHEPRVFTAVVSPGYTVLSIFVKAGLRGSTTAVPSVPSVALCPAVPRVHARAAAADDLARKRRPTRTHRSQLAGTLYSVHSITGAPAPRTIVRLIGRSGGRLAPVRAVCARRQAQAQALLHLQKYWKQRRLTLETGMNFNNQESNTIVISRFRIWTLMVSDASHPTGAERIARTGRSV